MCVGNFFALLAPSICDSSYKYFSEPGTAEMKVIVKDLPETNLLLLANKTTKNFQVSTLCSSDWSYDLNPIQNSGLHQYKISVVFCLHILL